MGGKGDPGEPGLDGRTGKPVSATLVSKTILLHML